MNAFAPRSPRRPPQLRAQRAPVSMSAAIVTMSAYQFPDLADISQTGAKLKGGPLPPKGTTGLFKVGGLEVLCRVVWTDGDQCGIRFDESVSPGVLKQIQLEGGAALEAFGTAGGKDGDA